MKKNIKSNYANNKNSEYDEYDFPVTSSKGYSYPFITFHKIKYDSKYWLKNEEENPSEINFIKNFNEKHFKKTSLTQYSSILKDLQKNNKINNLKNIFYIDYGDNIKLIYKASEDKEFLFENFIKAYLSIKNTILIMKTSINFYFIKTFNFSEDNWYGKSENYYIYYENENKLEKLNKTNLIIRKDNRFGNPQFELTNYFTIFNSYNSGNILKSKKNDKFSIIDIELFSLDNPKFNTNKYIPIK